MTLLRNVLWSGGTAALLSAAASAAASRAHGRRPDAPMNAVSHIAWGGHPPHHPGPGHRNLFVGAALHAGASLFWASIFEGLFGRWSRRRGANAIAAGIATAVGACVTDYRLVSRRFRPGFEVYLSRPSLAFVYAALAAGYALGAHLTRGDGVADREDDRRARQSGWADVPSGAYFSEGQTGSHPPAH